MSWPHPLARPAIVAAAAFPPACALGSPRTATGRRPTADRARSPLAPPPTRARRAGCYDPPPADPATAAAEDPSTPPRPARPARGNTSHGRVGPIPTPPPLSGIPGPTPASSPA